MTIAIKSSCELFQILEQFDLMVGCMAMYASNKFSIRLNSSTVVDKVLTNIVIRLVAKL
jgi:hypothetical protein